MTDVKRRSDKPLILIVDDELTTRLILRATLEEAEFRVIEASTVAEAVAQFQRHAPDLVLLDVLLPDGDGIELCRRFRQSPEGADTPIAMITVLDDLYSIKQAYDQGATDFITKPISWGTLGYRLRYLLRSQQALRALAINDSKTRALLSALPDCLMRLDSQARVLDVQSSKLLRNYGNTSCFEVGKPLSEVLPAVTSEALAREIQQCLQQQKPRILEFALNWPDAQRCYCEARLFPCGLHEVILILRDISERRILESQLRLSAKVFESSNEAILITDAQNRILSVNRMFERITGYSLAEVQGQDPKLLGSNQQTRSFFRNFWAELTEQGSWHGELLNRRKNGELYPIWNSVSLIRDSKGEPENYVAIFSDISERKQREAQIEYLAFHDALTGLANRRLLHERLMLAIDTRRPNGPLLALLVIDLDRFKKVNDSLGHEVGDSIINQVAIRLKQLAPAGITVSRLGGDEFALMWPNCDSAEAAATLAQQIVQRLSEPYSSTLMELHSTPSIGIVLYPADGEDASSLLKNADAAMYQAKEKGRANFQFYAPTLNDLTLGHLQLETQLRRAVANDEFVLYFQPKIDTASGKLIGVEALIRWQHPENGLLPPIRFIPVAEETGLIQPIGAWVLRHACESIRAWQQQGLGDIPVAINVSALQFKQPQFVELVEQVLAATGVDPALIELELTESILMQDLQQSNASLARLKHQGVRLSIDDFGTGFSSLNYLRHFPLDVLKIDQSFVREMFDDRAAMAIVDSIISLAQALGLNSIAEGVETVEQRDWLKTHGCDSLQGYLIARPMPEPELLRWCLTYRSESGSD